ncbi:MAG: hypothetical protein HKN09_05270 [Saprospiraceae bacterium]|nr:hypothetical protein [Saprospiraceae bacterium]
MKLFKILILSTFVLFLSCSSDDDNSSSNNCTELQAELNVATDNMLAAFGAYTQDVSNSELCNAYADALMVRIEKAQAMLDANCLPAGTTASTEQAIMEDQESLNGLDC